MTEQILFPLSQLLVSFINHTRLWKNWEREKSPSAHVAKRKSHGSESLGSRNASIELLPRAKLSSAATLFSTTIQNRVFSSCSLIHKKEHFTLKDFLTLQAGANYDEVFCLPPLKKKKNKLHTCRWANKPYKKARRIKSIFKSLWPMTFKSILTAAEDVGKAFTSFYTVKQQKKTWKRTENWVKLLQEVGSW